MPLLKNDLGSIVDIATMSTRMQHLVRYLEEVLNAMYEEFDNVFKSEASFIKTFDALVSKYSDTTFFSLQLELYQFIMNGIPSDLLKEWINERVGDRVLKNWERAMVNSYTSLIIFCQEFVIPACERLTVLLSSARGKSIWGHMKGNTLLDAKLVEDCLATLGYLQNNVFSFLNCLFEEKKYMKHFISWLNYAIVEFNTSEPSSIPPQEIIEHINETVIYIRHSLFRSKLTSYFMGTKPLQLRDPDYYSLKDFANQDDSNSVDDFVSFKTLKESLRDSFNVIFSYPSLTCQKQWLKTGDLVLFEGTDWNVSSLIPKSCNEKNQLFSLFFRKDTPNIFLIISQLMENTMLPVSGCHFGLDYAELLGSSLLDFQPATVLDMKLLNGSSILILGKLKEKCFLCEICLADVPLTFFEHQQKNSYLDAISHLPFIPLNSCLWLHEFEKDFLPSTLEYALSENSDYGVLISRESSRYRLFSF